MFLPLVFHRAGNLADNASAVWQHSRVLHAALKSFPFLGPTHKRWPRNQSGLRPGCAWLGGGGAGVATLILLAASCLCGTAQPLRPEVVYSFFTPPYNPQAELLQDLDGSWYGMTRYGGSLGYGAIFKLSTNGQLTTLVSFDGSSGNAPLGGLVRATDGYFYGTTSSGPGNNAGTVFKVTTNGVFSTVFTFAGTNGGSPSGTLLLAADGGLYGTTAKGGAYGYGTVFKVVTNGMMSTLASFSTTNGTSHGGGLVQGRDGYLYGTGWGGAANYGSVFRVSTNGVLTNLTLLLSAIGSTPQGTMIQASDGSFYGTACSGGANSRGTVFKVTPNGVPSNLASFDYSKGSNPQAGLLEGEDGAFYGTASAGGAYGCGTLFKVTTNGVLTALLSLNHTNGDSPRAQLMRGQDGGYYGTTFNGGVTATNGSTGSGTVFRSKPDGSLTLLASLDNNDAGSPNSGLMLGSDGAFYGTTYSGGAHACGSVFRVDTNGARSSWSFSTTGNSGNYPEAGLVEGPDQSFYGTTYWGGATQSSGSYGEGTVFKLSANRGLETVVSFARAQNGANLETELILGSDGAFYGATVLNAVDDNGALFRLTTNGATPLASFAGTNGAYPSALAEGTNHILYGITWGGGTSSQGTVFSVTTNGVLSSVFSFSGATTGSGPSGWVRSRDGNFYGTVQGGGAFLKGTVFRLTTGGELTLLALFDGANGNGPGNLMEASDGNFYGTTAYGGVAATNGAWGYGTVFRMTRGGALCTLASFGSYVWEGSLVEGHDGCLYGTTRYGGDGGSGSIYRLAVPPELDSAARTMDGRFAFNVSAMSNVSYSIEVSSNLVNWMVWTNVVSPGGALQFSDAWESGSRFYRAVLQ